MLNDWWGMDVNGLTKKLAPGCTSVSSLLEKKPLKVPLRRIDDVLRLEALRNNAKHFVAVTLCQAVHAGTTHCTIVSRDMKAAALVQTDTIGDNWSRFTQLIKIL